MQNKERHRLQFPALLSLCQCENGNKRNMKVAVQQEFAIVLRFAVHFHSCFFIHVTQAGVKERLKDNAVCSTDHAEH